MARFLQCETVPAGKGRSLDRLESLRVESCDFHFEHVDRDRTIIGFARSDQSWYMAIVAGGDIKTCLVPTAVTPTTDG